MTHWKKIVSDPIYLGEADFEEGQEIVVTIKRIAEKETVKTAEGASQKAVAHFEENVKPMILNVARSKSITKVAGTPDVERWPGVKVQLYIDNKVKAFGEVVSAVRVRDFKPREQTPVELCADCGGALRAFGSMSPQKLAEYTKGKYGRILCADCAKKAAEPSATEAVDHAE